MLLEAGVKGSSLSRAGKNVADGEYVTREGGGRLDTHSIRDTLSRRFCCPGDSLDGGKMKMLRKEFT